MMPPKDFPHLTEQNHRVTSPATLDYNCIAWSVGDVEHWWQPGVYWPIAAADDEYGIAILEQAFLALGFEDCVEQVLGDFLGMETVSEHPILIAWMALRCFSTLMSARMPFNHRRRP